MSTDFDPSAPSAVPEHLDALPAGTRLEEFEIQALLGVGGFGMVYRAFDHALQRQVAIKEYMPAAMVARQGGLAVTLRSQADQAAYQSGLRGFMEEARLLARFDHPALVKVFRFWEANGTAYMVMPLYRGLTLKAAREQMRCPPPEAWLRQVIAAVLGALRVLHQGQTLHRDVSPDNIFLQDSGPPVLLDLGAARKALADRTQHYTAVLKVNYAPVEQYADAEDMKQGPWTDLYALSAVVYGCLCNAPPLPATLRAVKDRLVPVRDVARVVESEFGMRYSESFVAALEQGLSLLPQGRPQSVEALAQVLGLEPGVAGLSRFDWRAELGDVYLPPGSEAPVRAASPSQADGPTVELAPRLVAVASAASAPEVRALAVRPTALQVQDAEPRWAPSAEPAPPARRSRVLAGLLALVVAAAGIGFLSRPDAPHRTPEAEILTESAEARVAVPLPASAAPVPVSTAAVASAAESPAPMAPKAAPAKAGRPPSTGVAVAAGPPPSAPAPAAEPARAAPAPAVPAPRPERPPARDPCADSSLLTRSMCLHQACDKPEWAAQPVCVEHRRTMQNRASQLGTP